MQELFIKKEKRELKKWTSIQDIQNNGYLGARLKNENEMNKIVMFSYNCFQVSKERYVFKHSRIRLATILSTIFHKHVHLDLIV
jgi:hypothetical protein